MFKMEKRVSTTLLTVILFTLFININVFASSAQNQGQIITLSEKQITKKFMMTTGNNYLHNYDPRMTLGYQKYYETKNSFEQEASNARMIKKKEEIIKIMDQLNKYKLKKLIQLRKEGKNDIQVKDEYELSLEQSLMNLGMREVTPNLMSNQIQSNYTIAKDSSIDSIYWREYSYTFYYSGTPYLIRELYASPNSLDSSLYNHGNDFLYQNRNYLADKLIEIASIYAQKAIGLIKVVGWLPYELLLTDPTDKVVTAHQIDYDSYNTVCFSSVKPYNLGDEYMRQTFVSNRLNVSSLHTLRYFYNGELTITDGKREEEIISAEDYASSYRAVWAYVNLPADQQGHSYVSSYTFYDPNRVSYIRQYVSTPAYPPTY